MVVGEDHQRQAVVVVVRGVEVACALVQEAQRGVDARCAERAVVSCAEDAVLVVGGEQCFRVSSGVLQQGEVVAVGCKEVAVGVGAGRGLPVDGGCLCAVVGFGCRHPAVRGTPTPALPRKRERGCFLRCVVLLCFVAAGRGGICRHRVERSNKARAACLAAAEDGSELADTAVSGETRAFVQGDAMRLQGGVMTEVVQDGAGFDGGELVGVAEEDEAGVRGGGGKEGGGEFEREHGGFVDDDVVVGQVARGVVLGNAVRADAEQAVQGAGAASGAADGFLRGVGKMGGRARQAFFHAVRRFAGRRGKGDAACGVFVQFGGDEVGKGVGFAGAGAAVDEG